MYTSPARITTIVVDIDKEATYDNCIPAPTTTCVPSSHFFQKKEENNLINKCSIQFLSFAQNFKTRDIW
jgi:hypothetical protein